VALRAPFRKLTVSGQSFVWKLRSNSLSERGDRHIVVSAPERASHLLIDPYPWDLEITPATVARAVEFALSRGWNPLRKGPPVILGYRNSSFFVLPPGVRFTHELPAKQLAAAPSANPARVLPSLELLARTVVHFNPWVDRWDLQELGRAFSEILFEPGRYWEAFERGSITRAELRNALVARAQTYVADAFRAPVSPEDLENAIVAELDRVLFGSESAEAST